jgi:hypothetical protein
MGSPAPETNRSSSLCSIDTIQEQSRKMSNIDSKPPNIKICREKAYDHVDNSTLIECFNNNSNIPFTKVSGVTCILVHASKPEDYTWCKYCVEKEKIVRRQLIEIFRIQKAGSFYEWNKQTLRMFWAVFDEDTWNKHSHVLTAATATTTKQSKKKSQSKKKEVVA